MSHPVAKNWEHSPPSQETPPLTNAELVQLQIRVIALENLVVALLAHAPEQQLELVRDIAASIFPRPGVEHRLTEQATVQMEHLAQRSQRLQCCLENQNTTP